MTFAIILISTATLIVGFIVFFFFMILRQSPLGTGNISKNLFTIRTGSVNFFIYKDSRNTVAFDAGFNVKESEFKKLEIDPRSITHVFLTHTDLDHTGGLRFMKNAKVYIGKNEEQMVNRTRRRMFGLAYNRLQSIDYTLLEDGEKLLIGRIRIQAIETPGHTPGSVSYLINDTILIVGDSLKLVNAEVGQGAFHKLFTMDHKAWVESIKKLARLKGIELMCTAHSGCTKDFLGAMTKGRS
jgi:glyoxylase-like metal-dependent hydrolase (beta-lactamase superfamily II)